MSPPETASSETPGSGRRRGVVLVSPLPPPQGGIAVWTETLLRRGLPPPWVPRIVDTRLSERTVADKGPSLLRELGRTARILFALFRSLLKGPRDIVHINCSLSPTGVFRDWACVITARLFRTPVVVNLRGNFTREAGGVTAHLRRAAYRSMFRSAAAIVPLSRRSREAVLSLGGFDAKTQLMPNFIDSAAIPERDEGAQPDRPFTAVYVGALLDSKGIDTIIETARRVGGVRFVLVGDAPLGRMDEIENHMASAGVRDRIVLKGPAPHGEALAAMASSDAYVLPSHSEGFPVSLAEAMAVGLPALASPVGAIPEMIDEGRGGYLIPHDEPGSYAEALAKLRDDPELARRMGRYNYEKARAQYDYEVVVSRWRDLYDRVADGV